MCMIGRWMHWSFKGASFLRVRDLTADMPFVQCLEERSYIELLLIFIEESVDEDTIFSSSLSLLLSTCQFHRI